MFDTKPADLYHKAVKRLAKAEAAHRTNLDALDAAREAREAAKVTPLRRDCEKSERELSDALQAAHAAHRRYWAHRRDELHDELNRVAILLAEYDALANLAGDASATPALTYLQNRAIQGHTGPNLLDQDVLVSEDGVPQDEPDSALFEDERGAWR